MTGSTSLARFGDIMVILVAGAALYVLIDSRRLSRAETPSNEAPSRYVEQWRDIERLGSSDDSPLAPVRLIEFVDYQCPSCARLNPILATLRTLYRDTLAITILHFPLRQHPFAVRAANAAECAHEQHRFGEMSAKLYQNQDALSDDAFWPFARTAGVPDSAQFSRCIASSDTLPRVRQGIRAAEELELPGTPALLIDGRLFTSVPTGEYLRALIERAIAEKGLRR